MATLYEQLEKAKRLDSKRISDTLFDFIKSIQKKFTDINTEQLNKDSEDIFGDPIGFYSRATYFLTGKSGPYDMYDTGDFLKGFYIRVHNEMIFFGSKDPKTPLILDNDNLLSRDLFGLQDDNLRELIERDLLPFVIQYSRKSIDV